MSGETPNLPAFSLRDPTTGSLSLQSGSTNILKFIRRLLFYNHIRFIYYYYFYYYFISVSKTVSVTRGFTMGKTTEQGVPGYGVFSFSFFFSLFTCYLGGTYCGILILLDFIPLFIEIPGLANLFSKYLLSTFLYASLHTSAHSLVSTISSIGPVQAMGHVSLLI